MKFTEAQLESAIIELLEAEGYPHVLGEAIDPPDGVAGRQPQEVLIKSDLRASLLQHPPHSSGYARRVRRMLTLSSRCHELNFCHKKRLQFVTK